MFWENLLRDTELWRNLPLDTANSFIGRVPLWIAVILPEHTAAIILIFSVVWEREHIRNDARCPWLRRSQAHVTSQRSHSPAPSSRESSALALAPPPARSQHSHSPTPSQGSTFRSNFAEISVFFSFSLVTGKRNFGIFRYFSFSNSKIFIKNLKKIW